MTEQTLNTYERDGVVKVENVLDSKLIEALREAIDHQTAMIAKGGSGYDLQSLADQIWDDGGLSGSDSDRFDLKMYEHLLKSDVEARDLRDVAPSKNGKSSGGFYYDAAGWRLYHEIREAALDGPLPKLVADLMRSRTVHFWEDTTFVKTPNASQRTAFHQDYGFADMTGDQCCIVWIPLDPVDADNGALQYLRGSHKDKQVYASNLLISQTTIPGADAPRVPDIETDPDAFDLVSFDVNPGDVVVHNAYTIHGASGNMTANRPRRAISFKYCGDDIRYQRRPGALPSPFEREQLEDGSMLHSIDFPCVWPRAYPGVSVAALYNDHGAKKAA